MTLYVGLLAGSYGCYADSVVLAAATDHVSGDTPQAGIPVPPGRQSPILLGHFLAQAR